MPTPPEVMWGGATKGFSAYPWLSYGCFDPCPDGQSVTVGPYVPFPFTPFWKKITSPFTITNKDGAARLRVGMGEGGLINICPPEWVPGYCKPWWIVKAFGFDNIIPVPEDEDLEFLPNIESQQPFTMLKMEVRGYEYGQFRQRVVFDIGSRLDVTFGPTQRLEADILVPDVERYLGAGLVVPEPFASTNFAAQSKIVPSAVQGDPIGHSTGRYTQSVFLTDPAQPTLTFDLPPAAKRVQVFVDDPTAPAPTVEFLLPLPAPTPPIVVETIVVGPDTEGDHEIADNAKQVRVSIGAGEPDRIVTLVFDLSF